jgi:hypothetical protein
MRPWLIGGVGLALFACLSLVAANYVHEHVPTIGRMERALDHVQPPSGFALLQAQSQDTCFGSCPEAERWYAVPGDPDAAQRTLAKALIAAGFTYHAPLGPQSLATWTGYGADISVQGFLAREDIYRPLPGSPSAPDGDNYVLMQAFPAMKR